MSQKAKSVDSPLLTAENIKKHFPVETGIISRFLGDEEFVRAVDGVDIELREGETVGVVGESGCGKTTLGRTVARLYEPSDGSIHFDDQEITDVSGDRLKKLRKNIQVIFQDPMSSLNPRKTVGEIVAKPLEIHDLASGDEKRERVIELFEEVGLQESHLDRYPHEFSGGQRQRVGIARALAVEPKLIIADEPVSALDVSVQAQIINLMKRLQAEYGISYLFIAHDLSVVKHISDRVAVMYLGKIAEKGSTEEIFENPQHPYTRALMNSIPRVDKKRSRRDILLEGTPPSPSNPPEGCPFHSRCPEFIGDECVDREPELEQVSGDSGSEDSSHVVACHWQEKSVEERQEQDPFN
ncbi:ABC transporter ATP-binding protein [Salinirarus marinus]